MTKQEVFDIAGPALLKQMKPSMCILNPYAEDEDKTEVCAYRGADGLKCAIGHIIPDEIYQWSMETCSTERLYADFDSFKTLIGSVEMIPFLEQLQAVHDEYDPPKWRQKLLDLADDFNLSPMSIISVPPII